MTNSTFETAASSNSCWQFRYMCICVLYPATALANAISGDHQKQKQNYKGGPGLRRARSGLANFCFVTSKPDDWHRRKAPAPVPSTTAVSNVFHCCQYSDSHAAIKHRNERRSASTVPLPNRSASKTCNSVKIRSAVLRTVQANREK